MVRNTAFIMTFKASMFIPLMTSQWHYSRCTGYRPILDAFKTFTKSDPKPYTEEAIAASKGLPYSNGGQADGAATPQGAAANGSSSVCPSTGMPCDCKKAGGGCGGGAKEGGGCGSCGTGSCSGVGAKAAQPGAPRPSIDPIFPPELKKRPASYLHMPGGIQDKNRLKGSKGCKS